MIRFGVSQDPSTYDIYHLLLMGVVFAVFTVTSQISSCTDLIMSCLSVTDGGDGNVTAKDLSHCDIEDHS